MNGRVEGWKIGRLEDWKVGRVEGWKSGRVEEWKGGRVEGWGERSISFNLPVFHSSTLPVLAGASLQYPCSAST